MVVVDEWTGAAADQRDDSRKELIDAGKFAPALAATLLVDRSQLARSLCAAPLSWLVGPASAPQDHPWLAGARQLALHRDVALWRVEAAQPEQRAAMGCP